MKGEQEISSHLSQLRNYLNSYHFMDIEARGLAAKDTPTIPTVQLYYNSVYNILFSFPILRDHTDFINKFFEYKRAYLALYDGIINRQLPQNMRNVRQMVDIVDSMYFLLTSTLQDRLKYFYRTTDRIPKGLNHITEFIENNIFAQKVEQGDEDDV